ncbi:hypothetical protein Droror1_Dr00017790, partial [Drosera rotundifolia]
SPTIPNSSPPLSSNTENTGALESNNSQFAVVINPQFVVAAIATAQSNKELLNRIVDLELRHRSAMEELQRTMIGRAEAEERKRWKRECEATREA